MLWIRIQIGSVFSNFSDPDPYSEFWTGSTYFKREEKRLDWLPELSSHAIIFAWFKKKTFLPKSKLFVKNYFFLNNLTEGLDPEPDPDPNWGKFQDPDQNIMYNTAQNYQ